jgi:hypothetical protein
VPFPIGLHHCKECFHELGSAHVLLPVRRARLSALELYFEKIAVEEEGARTSDERRVA